MLKIPNEDISLSVEGDPRANLVSSPGYAIVNADVAAQIQAYLTTPIEERQPGVAIQMNGAPLYLSLTAAERARGSNGQIVHLPYELVKRQVRGSTSRELLAGHLEGEVSAEHFRRVCQPLPKTLRKAPSRFIE